MKELTNITYSENTEQYEIVELSEELLSEVRESLDTNKSISIPIAELSTFGAAFSSFIPAFHTITQTTTISGSGLYKIANQAIGDTLKIAKDGNAWGAMKTASGKSKMVKLTEVGPLSATNQTVLPIDPATIMMSIALYSIEKSLDEIKDSQKQIIDFLKFDKQAEIETDLENLNSIVSAYKYTWDNELQKNLNHKSVNEAKTRALKNMNFYQKQINTLIANKQMIVVQEKIKSTYHELNDCFQYYKLSLYIFAFASLLEILLSGNYGVAYISQIKEKIKKASNTYRETFKDASLFLEKMSHSGIETNIIKGVGTAGKLMGKAIGSIPLIEKGPVDEFLHSTGKKLEKDALGIENRFIKQFSTQGNPRINVFVQRIEDMETIFNQNNQIYFDQNKVYVVTK